MISMVSNEPEKFGLERGTCTDGYDCQDREKAMGRYQLSVQCINEKTNKHVIPHPENSRQWHFFRSKILKCQQLLAF